MNNSMLAMQRVVLLMLLTSIALDVQAATPPKELKIYWYEVEPFIYEKDGRMEGLEYDIVDLFIHYLDKHHPGKYKISWHHETSFVNVFLKIKEGNESALGVSSFSVTEERKKFVQFTKTYLPDVTVLITSRDVPFSKDQDEFHSTIYDRKLTAVTTPFTTFEHALKDLKSVQKIDFPTQYVANDDLILLKISSGENLFGYTDFPIYMRGLNKGLKIKRQHNFNILREGYGFIYPKNSDLDPYLNEFFNDPNVQQQISTIIARYLSSDVLDLLKHISSEGNSANDTYFLIKEEEILADGWHSSFDALQKELTVRNILLALVGFVVTLIVLLSIIFYKSRKYNYILLRKNRAIQIHRERIRRQLNQLQGLNFKLAELNRSKDQIIRIVAHDLKSPLNQISGLIELFKCTEPEATDEQKEILRMISSSIENQRRLIKKILDAEAIESETPKLDIEPCLIHGFIRGIVSGFTGQAIQKEIQIETEFVGQDMCIHTDRVLLTNILQNLVSNALKFSFRGGAIAVRCVNLADGIRVEVHDNGQGIEPAELEKLFKKYQQLSSLPTENEDSTGLGLFIVKRFVEALNGRVWCESIKHVSTSFYVELPAKSEQAETIDSRTLMLAS